MLSTVTDRAVGMPARAMNCLAKTLLPSSCAAARCRSNNPQSARRESIYYTRYSGASGPTTVRSAPISVASLK